jgi:hypothetical protein
MDNTFLKLDPEKIREFTGNLREKDEQELRNILTRYIEYLPEMTEAALIVSVDKGFMPYDLREKLSRQIMTNIEAHQNGISPAGWKKDNAFRDFVAKYTDDELYDLIDRPSDIVIDVYTAILEIARERELISDNDSEKLTEDTRLQSRSDREIKNDDLNDFAKDIFGDMPDELTAEQIEEEKQKYWVCPKCHEMVEVEMDVCWNCQAEAPAELVHPGTEEIIKEQNDRKPFSFTRSGFTLLILGVVLMGVGILHKFGPGTHFHWFRWDGIILGAVAIIFGIFFLIKGAGKNE